MYEYRTTVTTTVGQGRKRMFSTERNEKIEIFLINGINIIRPTRGFIVRETRISSGGSKRAGQTSFKNNHISVIAVDMTFRTRLFRFWAKNVLFLRTTMRFFFPVITLSRRENAPIVRHQKIDPRLYSKRFSSKFRLFSEPKSDNGLIFALVRLEIYVGNCKKGFIRVYCRSILIVFSRESLFYGGCKTPSFQVCNTI